MIPQSINQPKEIDVGWFQSELIELESQCMPERYKENGDFRKYITVIELTDRADIGGVFKPKQCLN